MKINMEKNKRFAKERIVYINAIKIFLLVYFSIYLGFPSGSMVKKPPANTGDWV